MQVHPDQQSTGGSRHRFLTDVVDSLILFHMKTRQKIPQLQKATKEAMMRCGLSFSNTSRPENILQKKKRCSLCPHTKDRKMAKCCSRCSRPVCPEQSITPSPPSHAMNECYERKENLKLQTLQLPFKNVFFRFIYYSVRLFLSNSCE